MMSYCLALLMIYSGLLDLVKGNCHQNTTYNFMYPIAAEFLSEYFCHTGAALCWSHAIPVFSTPLSFHTEIALRRYF